MHRPGTELAICRSQVRRPNYHYTTEPSSLSNDFMSDANTANIEVCVDSIHVLQKVLWPMAMAIVAIPVTTPMNDGTSQTKVFLIMLIRHSSCKIR